MPKTIIAELTVPSGSRAEKLHSWLSNLLAPHRMAVLTCVEKPEGSAVPEMVEILSRPSQHQLAWEEMHNHLKWMQGHPDLGGKYLGRNFAEVANMLIDEAYPGMRERAKP